MDIDDEKNNLNPKLLALIFFLKCFLWIVLYLLCLEIEIGAIFVILSAFFFMFTNFSQREKGKLSAYSGTFKQYSVIMYSNATALCW